MNKKDELKIFEQLKKYDLINVFKDGDDFDLWYYSLNKKQKYNFINLNISPNVIKKLDYILLDTNLLQCDDYQKRVEALSKLNNLDESYYLLSYLCAPNFLKSANFYSDIELISKAKNARYALCVISKDTFINSPYHNEDLELIVNAKDRYTKDEYDLDFIVARALVEVASNEDSINSEHHREDMQLISNANPHCLQEEHSFPLHSLNKLAINKVSLKDKRHLENMKILNINPEINLFLYDIMTNEKLIKNDDYEFYITSIVGAKTYKTALAIYAYITKQDYNMLSSNIYIYKSDITHDEFYNLSFKFEDLFDTTIDKKYITLINSIPDDFIIAIENLMINKRFMLSQNHDFDLNTLIQIANKHQSLKDLLTDEELESEYNEIIKEQMTDINEVFYKIHRLLLNDKFINSPYHVSDLKILSNEEYVNNIQMLINKATNENYENHEYDMNYIAHLNVEDTSDELFKEASYLLYDENGINDVEHIKKLTDLKRGFRVDASTKEERLLNHVKTLEKKILTEKH